MSDESEIILFTVSGASTAAAVVYYIRNKRQQKKLEELYGNIDKLNQELKFLEVENAATKLNPHLLKNTLNTIYSYSWQATTAIEKLSEMLNYILNESKRKYVPLGEEIEFLNTYYMVHKMKLSPQAKVNFKINMNADHKNLKIAPLITVNFIENAFVHGDFAVPDSLLEIVVTVTQNEMIYEVKNTFSKSEPSTGMGNDNFKRRLELLHKGNYEVSTIPTENTYTAKLNLKLNES